MYRFKLIFRFFIFAAIYSCVTKKNPNYKRIKKEREIIQYTDGKKSNNLKGVEQNLSNSVKKVNKLHFVFFPGVRREGYEYFTDIKKRLIKKYSSFGIKVEFSCMGKNHNSIENSVNDRAKYIVDEEFEDILKNKKEGEIITVLAHSQGGITFLNCLDCLKHRHNIDLHGKISYAHFASVPFGGSISAIRVNKLLKFTSSILCSIRNLMVFLPFIIERLFFMPFLRYKYNKIPIIRPDSIAKNLASKIFYSGKKKLNSLDGILDLANSNSKVMKTAMETLKNIKSIIPYIGFLKASTDFVVSERESFGEKLNFSTYGIVNRKKTIQIKGSIIRKIKGHGKILSELQLWDFITDRIDQDWDIR